MKSLYKKFNINSIINSSSTSKSDLEHLAKKLNIPVSINWLKDFKNTNDPQIINLGNEVIGGTHWIATYAGKYFDPFGLPSPPQLSHLEWIPLRVQSIRSGHCGTYSMLWLYYVIMNEEDKFFNLFDTSA